MVTDCNVAYLGCIDPRHAESDLDDIVAAGCTSITMTVDECDWAYYRNARRAIARGARARGLRLYLGLHGFGIFSTPIPSNQYPLEHPEACQVYNTGRHGFYACPNNTGFADWLKSTVGSMIAEYQPDGMFWDEPAFCWSSAWPAEWACRCSTCQAAFQDQFGVSMPHELTSEVRAFRQDSILRFLEEIVCFGKQVGGGESILCLMPWVRSGKGGTMARGWYGVEDWEPFAQLPALDVFSTDPYWIHSQPYEYFESNTAEAVRLARKHRKKCQIWVQAVWIGPGKEPEVRRTILAAAEMGADMLAVWSYRGETGAHVLDYGGDADLVWQMVVEAYGQLASN